MELIPNPLDKYLSLVREYDKAPTNELLEDIWIEQRALEARGFDMTSVHQLSGLHGGGWNDFTNWVSKAYDDTVGKIPVVGSKIKEVVSNLPPVLAIDAAGKVVQHAVDGHPEEILGDVADAGRKFVNQRSLASIAADGTPLAPLADAATAFAERAIQVPGTGMSASKLKERINGILG